MRAEVCVLSPVCSRCDALEALVLERGRLFACGVAAAGLWCECSPDDWQSPDSRTRCVHVHALVLAVAGTARQ